MEKKLNETTQMVDLSCTAEFILHRIGSEYYPEMRRTRVPATDADNWSEIAVADIPPYTRAQYRAKVVELIRERYDANKEFELQRQMLEAMLNPEAATLDETGEPTEPEAVADFRRYNDYVKECKQRATDPAMYAREEEHLTT